MANYDDIAVLPGMVGTRNGWTYSVQAVSSGSVHAICLDDQTEADMDEAALKALCNSGEMRVDWPPGLRQENMP